MKRYDFVIHKVKNINSYRLRYRDLVIGFYGSRNAAEQVINICMRHNNIPETGINYDYTKLKKGRDFFDDAEIKEFRNKWDY